MPGTTTPEIVRSSSGPSIGAIGTASSPLALLGSPLAKAQSTNYQNFNGSSANGVTVNDEEHAVPFWVQTAATLTDIAIWVVTGGASNTCRFGLRADAGGTNPYPGTLITDYGTSTTQASGASAGKTGLTTALTARTIYWLTFTLQTGTPAVVTCFSGAGWQQMQDSIAAANTFSRACGYKQTGVSGALSTFSSTVTAVTAITTPKPVVRLG